MSVHDFHDALPGYDERQILHDGCGECEARGADVVVALQHLDYDSFQTAWQRAADWNHAGTETMLGQVSRAEADLLRVLWIMQVQLERRGVPIGHIPTFGDAFEVLA